MTVPAPLRHAVGLTLLLPRWAAAEPPEWVRLHGEGIAITQTPGARQDLVRLGQAAEKLEAALKLHGDPTLVWDLANIEKLGGHHARAAELFNQLVATWPDYEKNPKARAYLNDLNETLRLTPEVRFDTEPAGAQVLLKSDARSVEAGATPVRDVYAKPGEYRLSMRLPGYLPVEETVAVQVGEALIVKRKLVSEREAGTLKVRVEPEWLRVELDGQVLGTSPLRRSVQVAAGVHQLHAVDAAGTAVDRTAKLAAGGTATLTVEAAEVATAPEPQSSKGPVILLGAGGAAVVTGGVLLALAVGKSGDSDAAARASEKAFGRGDVETGNSRGKVAVSLSKDAATWGTAGYVVGGLGLAAAGAGLYWRVTGDEAAAPDEPTAAVVPLGWGVGLGGRF